MSATRTVHTTFFARPAAYAPWSAGMLVPAGCDLLFTPGMTARDADGETVAPGDVAAQARRVFEQLRAVLGEVGADLDAVVKLTVFLADMDDVEAVQAVRNELWPSDPPVSSTVQVARLVSGDVRVEIEAVAAIERGA